MSERPEGSPPNRHPTARSRRRPRFELPADHHDERVGERIEAFLEGPPIRARRTRRPRHLRHDGLRPFRRTASIDTRADWDIALRHEDARVHRYGRPAAVLAVRLRVGPTDVEDRYAARVGSAIRQHTRETDRVTRMGPDRFRVLLPETHEAEATLLAERVRKACADLIPGARDEGPVILVASASTAAGGSLVDALRSVEARIEA